MESGPRFKESAFDRRPYGTHRYDVYAPKLQRQLTLFGRRTLDLWTTLEASPQVLSYCERPLIVPDSRPQRAFDFWVRRPHGEELLILLHEGDLDTPDKEVPDANVRALEKSTIDGIPVVCLDPKDIALQRTALANWGTIIRDLAAFQRFVPEPLCRELREALGQGKTIAQLQSELTEFDSSTVRLAVFVLLHRGQAACRQLVTQALGPDHLIERS
jgi:hypothetical protein